jgi:uncharacterized OB-fold protein
MEGHGGDGVIESMGTYLPPWGTAGTRLPGDDEDVATMAVAAGLQAMAAVEASAITAVELVSRDLPLLEGGNGAAVLAGLGLASGIEVREQIGGAPAALEAVARAVPGTLIIGADVKGGAGAAAAVIGTSGVALRIRGRTNRSLPVVTRDAHGVVTDYGDPRLLRELGVRSSLDQVGLTGKVAAVAGLGGKDAAQLSVGDPPALPTLGASSALFALAALAERRDGGRLLAVEQATIAVAELASGPVPVSRDEPAPRPPLKLRPASEADIAISLAAYERAFDAKLRLVAARCTSCGTLSYPQRLRCLGCGSEAPVDTVALPREAEVYTLATIHVPVPGLATPYTVVLVELGDSGVRLLGRLTGAPAGSVAIGDRGRMVFRRVAVRTGVPDYGYAFLPEQKEVAA